MEDDPSTVTPPLNGLTETVRPRTEFLESVACPWLEKSAAVTIEEFSSAFATTTGAVILVSCAAV